MQSNYPHPLVAREGWIFLAIALAVALAVSWFAAWWSLPFWLVALFVLQFFRDPPRKRPADRNAVCSPADGRIVAVDQAENPYTGDGALKISVFMNVFNVHSNRSPVDGVVTNVVYNGGKFFNAALAKSSTENERNALNIRLDDGSEVTCVQIAGLIARRILCYVKTGDRLERGQRFGFIRFGSRVDLYLAPHARPQVTVGDKVYAGETIVAQLENGLNGQ